MKCSVLSLSRTCLQGRGQGQRKEGRSLPHLLALRSSHEEGWGLMCGRKSVPGLDKAPSQAAWHFKGKGGPACQLSLGEPQA